MKRRKRSSRRLALGLCAGAALACAEHVSRGDLAARIARGDAPVIVDVRSEAEYREARVPGAVHVPFHALYARREQLPDAGGEPLVLYCEHGPRAGIARAQLWLAGIGPVRFLEGHMSAWKADGLPVASGAGGDQPRR